MTIRRPKSNNRRGFTLVELSIVLVIIGLIIGGVLTGQQIIQNARITKALNDVQAYEAQFQTYQQNYGALPGDDAGATGRFTNATVGNGNGNGTIDTSFDFACGGNGGSSVNTTTESCTIWSDLRAAGLVKNQVPVSSQPPNPFSGISGLQNGAFNGAFTTTVLCMNNVPGSAAQALDTRLDDGNANGGSIEAMVGTGTVGEASGGTVATSYNATSTYTMCLKI